MSYKKLKIWQSARELSIEIHLMTMKLPKFEFYETGSQIRRSSKSIRSNIVETWVRLIMCLLRLWKSSPFTRRGFPRRDPYGKGWLKKDFESILKSNSGLKAMDGVSKNQILYDIWFVLIPLQMKHETLFNTFLISLKVAKECPFQNPLARKPLWYLWFAI